VAGNPYPAYAAKAVATLTSKWFTSHDASAWIPGDYWKVPTICIELIDAMQVSGEASYVSTLEAAYKKGQNYIGSCSYLDDESVWGRLFVNYCTWLEQVDAQLAADFKSGAGAVHDDLESQGWDDTCDGGCWWARPGWLDNNVKASNTTLGYMEISLGLARLGEKGPYVEDATTAWSWLQEKGFIDGQGWVWGSLAADCKIDPSNKPVLALQGNPLLPLWEMYEQTQETSFLDTAQLVVGAAIEHMTWPGTQIMTTPIDAEWDGEDSQWRQDNLNPALHKGIFAGYLGDFARNLATVDDPARQEAAAGYGAFLRANADAVWTNYPGGAYGMDWHTPHTDYQPDANGQVNACLQFSALAAFLAAAKNPG
jgi:hypothetical protein